METALLCAAGAFAAAGLITYLSGLRLIPFLHKLKFGQHILEIGPNWHKKKQGTPTMGGITFILGIIIAVAVFGMPYYRSGDFRPIMVLLPALVFGGAGMIDDMTKFKKKQNEGLTPLQKLALQTAAAVLYLSLLRFMGYDNGSVYIPFVNISIDMNWYIYAVIAAIFIVFMDNAANLTDGVDGLCAGVTVPVALFFTAAALYTANGKYLSVAVPAAALAGGMAAFLIFNYNPAKVFMGDTGSLFIGGMVCALAFALGIPTALIIAGAIYILEAVSVILQVAYFKLSKGKRIFRMAPIHHHFEMGGWNEKQIFRVFTTITLCMCLLAFIGILSR